MEAATILCILLTCAYSLLFLGSCIQLIRILIAQHDLHSFQCGFLLLAVLWSCGRIFFFGEWFALPELLSLLLWWLPFDLQFCTFSLLVVFYASLIHHQSWQSLSTPRSLYIAAYLLFSLTVPLLTVAWSLSILAHRSPQSASAITPLLEAAHHAFIAFQLCLLLAVFAWHGYRLHQQQRALSPLLLHAPFPLSVLTALCLTVFLSRAIFAVLNATGRYRIEIGGDDGGIKQVSVAAFVLLMLWEITPTTAVLLYFHHIPGRGHRRRRQSSVCCCRRGADRGDDDGRGADGDSESERSGSPTSHLSHADELEQDLLFSQTQSHSFSAALPNGSSVLARVQSLNSPLLSPSPSSLSPPAPPPGALQPQPQLQPSYTQPQRPHPLAAAQAAASAAPPAVVLPPRARLFSPWQPPPPPPPTLSAPAQASFSLSPPFLSPPLASASPTASVLFSPSDSQEGSPYSAAADRWRRGRRDDSGQRGGGGRGAGAAAAAARGGDGSRGFPAAAAAGRSVDDDEDEYRYSASLDYDA